MTRDEIIEMARDSGMELYGLGKNREKFLFHLQAFAKLIAAKEREACAQVCEDNADDFSEGDWDSACNNCADHIRARCEEC